MKSCYKMVNTNRRVEALKIPFFKIVGNSAFHFDKLQYRSFLEIAETNKIFGRYIFYTSSYMRISVSRLGRSSITILRIDLLE